MRRRLDFSFSAALRELEAVHRHQARLLRGACALACARTTLGRLYVAGFEHALSIWDRDCAEEIETARVDGFDLDPWLPRLLDQLPIHWPRATTLALAALSSSPATAPHRSGSRPDRGGESSAAIGELRELLGERPAPPVRGTALEASRSPSSAPAARASLACYGRPRGRQSPAIAVTIALLALALREGQPRRLPRVASARAA
jgi:hypothetical protein